MSSQTHPDSLALLRFADGELEPKEARRVRQHLDSCWQCRTELEDIERTIGESIRYRNNVLQTNLPSPPAPWMDIQAAFSRLDAATGRVSFAERIFGRLRGGARWLVPAAAAAALCVAVYQWRETPSVRAAELLKRASAAAEAQPSKARRIQIRTATRRLTRTVGVRPAAAAPDDALAALFRSANYSWEDPLSAKSFQEWRETLPRKRDEVAEEPGRTTIRTSTEAGELASASLKLDTADFRPLEGRLEFRNREVVEIAELPEEVPVEAAASVDAAPPRQDRSLAEPGRPAVAERGPGAAEELKVMAALHGVGADLGDPLEIERTPAGIVVKGIGVAPERQREIREALRAAPGATVRFTEPEAAPPAGGAPHSAGPPAAGDALRFQAQFERQLGGRAQYDDFSLRLLEAGEAAMSRAYALRRLAQRFPAGAETALDAAGRAALSGMAKDHANELARAVSNLERLTGPVLGALGGTASAVQQKSTDSRAWQAATEELFQSAQRVERLLAAMLDGSPANPTTADLPTRLLTGLARLRAEAENYRRLLLLETAGDGK